MSKNRAGMIFSFSEVRAPCLFSFETSYDPEAEKRTINSAGSSQELAASWAGDRAGRRGARAARGQLCATVCTPITKLLDIARLWSHARCAAVHEQGSSSMLVEENVRISKPDRSPHL